MQHAWPSLPTELWVPLLAGAFVPVLLAACALLLLRSRRVNLATRLTFGVVTVFGGALGLWALLTTRAIVDNSLDDLARQQLPAVVRLAEELSGRAATDPVLLQRVAPRLATFRSADQRFASAAVIRLGCETRCTIGASGIDVPSLTAETLRQSASVVPTAEQAVVDGGLYQLVSAAVRDDRGVPFAALRVAIDARGETMAASRAVSELLVAAWLLLGMVAFTTWRFVRASVSERVRVLLRQIRGDVPTAGIAQPADRDELAELSRAIDATVDASVQRQRSQDMKYRELLDHAPWGIGRLDVAHRISAANPALARLAGVAHVDELTGRNLGEFFVRPAEATRLLARRDNGSGEDAAHEVQWKALDGTRRTVSVTIRRLDAESELLVQDVTDRRALETQLAQSQKMEALGQLTGGIAHDFNNLLTVITATVPLVREQLRDDSTIVQEDLRAMEDASRRGGALVKKLLAFSKGDTSERRSMSVATLLHETGFLLRRLMPENIRLRMPTAMPDLRVTADRVAVEQILLNLATNARDAMPEGGDLSIEAYAETLELPVATRLGLPRAGAYVVIEARDSGVGIALELHQRVFEPFFTTKPLGSGSGLGLAMVYGLMTQHQGAVRLESAEGVGTFISLYFPAAAPAAADARAVAPAHVDSGGQRRVLLVEDEPEVQRVTRRILESVGYVVDVADDGILGLERLAADHTFSAVVSDVMMPRMGGPAMLRHARASGVQLPFIFVTGHSTQSLDQITQQDPGVRVLSKPWIPSDLARVLAESLVAAELIA